MRCFFLIAAHLVMLPGLVRADHSDDTLRYYLSKTELCVAGTIASEPIGVVREAGVVNYTCEFAVSGVLRGELKDKTIQVNVIRHEIGEADRPADLKKDARCILFLKAQPRSVPPWATVDFWFGYQPYSSTMAGALKRVAQSTERLDAKPPDGTKPDGKRIERTAELAGSWVMSLPSGATFVATTRAEGDRRLHLQCPGRFTGTYELRDGRLVMVKPGDPAEVGFEWEVRGADEIVLVAQRKLEFDYRGATLKRQKDDRATKQASADGPAPKKADRPAGLAGTWRMTLPRGAQYTVTLRPEGEKQFHLENAVRFSGLYELRDGRLVMVKPTDPAEVGFEWEVRGPDALTLVAQRERTGANYLGATLKRVMAAEKPLKDDGAGASSDVKPEGPADGKEDMSEEEKKAAEALRQIKREHLLRKEPTYVAPVQYCLLLLGREAKTRLWLASDGTTMYVDRNGNGDLTDPGEAIPYKNGFATLMPDTFPGHDGDSPYTSLHIAVRQRDWEKNTGGYWAVRADVGRTYHTYAMVHKFARKPEDAPVVHLGGPLRMGLNDLVGGALVRGRQVELEAYAACHYPGVERAYVDVDRRCPTDVHPFAEIRLPAGGGAEPLTLRVPLTKRC